MKNILSIAVAMLISTSAMFAGAIENPNASTGMAIMKNGTTIKLFYKGTRPADVKVSILDAKNKLVYAETIQNVDGFVRPYNFSNLKEGEYTIELVGENGRQVERVNYHFGKVEKLANVLHVAGEPSKYILTVANKGADVLTVKIYDSIGTLLYNAKEEADGDFARIYNLENYHGAVTFEVTDSNGVAKTLSL